jgi:chromosome segregation ATPase
MFGRIFACAAFAALVSMTPLPSSAASKEIQELQRDVAQLQDQLKQLQQSQDRQLAELRVLVQQSLAASTDANKSVAVIQSGFQQNLRDQEAKVVTPVVGLGTRMDQMSQDLHTVQQAVTDLSSLMGKLQAQLTDLNNAIKVMSTPAPPPPGATSTTPGDPGPDDLRKRPL